MIATHNSATGERGHGFLSWIVKLFSKCQSKNLVEQYEAGCRYFDIRYRWSNRRGRYICAHGFWESKKTLYEIIETLDNLSYWGAHDWPHKSNDKVYIMLTYEGNCDKSEALSVTRSVKEHLAGNDFIQLTSSNIKCPKWHTIEVIYPLAHVNKYKVLDGSSWHTYIPIPWLWAKLYPPKLNPDTFNFVDFL